MADAFNRRDWDAFLALADGDGIEVESRLVGREGRLQGARGTAAMVGQLPRCLS